MSAGWKMRLSRGARPVVAILLLSLLLIPGARAQSGALDPSFGEDGRVRTPFNASGGVAIAAATDGSLVVAQKGLIRRYRANGRPESTWGTGGQVRLPREIEGLSPDSGSLEFDSQGRLLSFSSVSDPKQLLGAPAALNSLAATWELVLRLDPRGNVDSSFGDGRGFVRSDFGLRSSLDSTLASVHSQGLVDSQDRPVLLVRVADLAGRCTRIFGQPGYTWYPRAVVRLTTAGAPDSTFGGGDGIADISGEERSSTLSLGKGDTPVASAGASNCRGSHVFQFREDGAPSSTFGAVGSRIYPDFLFSLVDPSGGIILRREAGLRTSVLARTKRDGDLDPRFGRQGKALVTMRSGIERELQPVAVDARRRVLLVGCLSVPVSGTGRQKTRQPGGRAKQRYRDIVVIGRLTSGGRPDRTFGNQGWISTRFSSQRDIAIDQAVLDDEGRLLVLVRSGSAHILTRYLLKG